MKRTLFCVVGLALVLSLLATACAEPTPAPAPAPTPAPAPAPTPAPAPAKPIELIANTPTGVEAPPGKCLQEWADKIEEQSEGRVKITIYFSNSLFEQREVMRAMLAGVADIASSFPPREDPGLLALNMFYELPFLGWHDSKTATVIYRELLDTIPEAKEEWQGLKLICPIIMGDSNWLHSAKKLIQTSDDLKGTKPLTSGYVAKWFELMGATPVSLTWGDFYMGFEKGIVDVNHYSFANMMASGIFDLVPYHTILPTSLRASCFMEMMMNPDSWEGLPSDIKKMIEDLEPWYTQRRIDIENEGDKALMAKAKEAGHTFVELSPEETQKWIEAAKPLHEEWIEELEANGKPGRKFYDELQRLIAKYAE